MFIKTVVPLVFIFISGALGYQQNGTVNNLTIIMAPYDTIQIGPNVINVCNGSNPDNSTGKKEAPELYWKDYRDAHVPEDAVVLGVQEGYWENISIYVGQALFNVDDSGIQPVGVLNMSNVVNGTYKKAIHTDRNIKVLCSNVENDKIDDFLTWIPSYNIGHYTLVQTGYEINRTISDRGNNTYTGRFWENGHLYVGKVVNNTLRYPVGEREFIAYDFDVLAYTNSNRTYALNSKQKF